jgi:hypothetical protein
MQLAEASHYFPFNVPIFHLWDGGTYGPWLRRDGYFHGLYYEMSYPSASTTEYIPVCGPGTGYNVQFSLEELIKLYWRVRSFHANISISGASLNGVAERQGYISAYYSSDGSLQYYKHNGLARNETYPLVDCPYNQSNNAGFYLGKTGAWPPYVFYEITVGSPSLGPTYYWYFNSNPYYSNIVADPNGNYWVHLNIDIRSRTPGPAYFDNAIGCHPYGEYIISSSGEFKVRGDTCYGYRTDTTKPTNFTFTAFGKMVPLYGFEWSWPDPSLPSAGDMPKLDSGSVSININDYFDYIDKPIVFLKDF